MEKIITLSRPFLLILIILIHCQFEEKGLLLNGAILLDIQYLIVQIIARIAVPIYFFTSGWLVFRNKSLSKEVYFKILKKRSKTLLLPYIIWNIFYLLMIFGQDMLRGNFTGVTISDVATAFVAYKGDIYPILIPLWYVRDLMLFVLMSPILYRFGKSKANWIIAAIFFILWELKVGNNYFVGGFAGILFFYLGILVCITKIDMIELFHKLSKYYYHIITLFLTAGIFLTSYRDIDLNALKNINIIIGIVAFLLTIYRYQKRLSSTENWVLSNNSFFIYCLHGMFIAYITALLNKIALLDVSPVLYIAIYVIIILLFIYFLLIVNCLIKKFFPIVYTIISGNRK